MARLCVSALAASLGLALGAANRGYNSWDNFLGNCNESETLSIAQYMSSTLKPFGFDLLTIDEGWYYSGAPPGGITLDANGRPVPNPAQYPSAAPGTGFRAISAQLHALGLRLGVWTIRGIPAAAVAARLPIANSPYTADQAVRLDRNCSWNGFCLGCADAPGGGACNDAARAYYASLAAWYVEQGIDLVKIDCMWPGGGDLGAYNHDLAAFTDAFRASGVEVSLSPGIFVNTQNATWVAETQAAVQYRVTQDFWDEWADAAGPDGYPTGLRSKLDKAVEFAAFFGRNGTYADLDMMPLGDIYHMAQGPFGPSNLTHNEQRLLVTLWCATGTPLIFGGRLPLRSDDAWTLSLITNAAVLAVHNESSARAPLTPAEGDPATSYAWASVPEAGRAGSGAATGAGGEAYVSLFNAADADATVGVETANIPGGIAAAQRVCATDLWTGAALPPFDAGVFAQPLAPHAAGMFLLRAC